VTPYPFRCLILAAGVAGRCSLMLATVLVAAAILGEQRD
jgi:hypothetical protein